MDTKERAVRELYDARARRDWDAVRSLLADEVGWHEPGEEDHSGDYRGREEVVVLLQKLVTVAEGTFQLEPEAFPNLGEHSAVLVRWGAERQGSGPPLGRRRPRERHHLCRACLDPKEGPIAPKSKAGRRKVPIAAILRDFLDAHRLRTAWADGFVFGRSAERPFDARGLPRRAETAWKGLEPINLHECRHTFASLMIAAGVNAKALSSYTGHASITVTLDLYGHLMPGNEDAAAELLDAYLARADTAARLAQIEATA